MRLHRWVRGLAAHTLDWQICEKSKGEKVKNPLSVVARWKIVDNLRRVWWLLLPCC